VGAEWSGVELAKNWVLSPRTHPGRTQRRIYTGAAQLTEISLQVHSNETKQEEFLTSVAILLCQRCPALPKSVTRQILRPQKSPEKRKTDHII